MRNIMVWVKAEHSFTLGDKRKGNRAARKGLVIRLEEGTAKHYLHQGNSQASQHSQLLSLVVLVVLPHRNTESGSLQIRRQAHSSREIHSREQGRETITHHSCLYWIPGVVVRNLYLLLFCAWCPNWLKAILILYENYAWHFLKKKIRYYN